VPSRLTFLYRQRIAEFALRQRLPAIGGWTEFSEAGGLLAYGPNLRSTVRQAAVYVHRVLGGAKPADLPVEPPARIELVINLKTAPALGLTLPQPLLVRATALIK
jgi:putative ABC transport system substrate-binding protein